MFHNVFHILIIFPDNKNRHLSSAFFEVSRMVISRQLNVAFCKERRSMFLQIVPRNYFEININLHLTLHTWF